MRHKERKIRRLSRYDLPTNLDEAIGMYGLDYVLEIYKQTLEAIN